MDRKFLCTAYEGPETWAKPLDEWRDPSVINRSYLSDDDDDMRQSISDEEHAATEYREACFDGDDDPGDDVKVAVIEPATGRRWVVTVYGEVEITWHGESEEVV